MSNGQVKKYSARLYFLECPALLGSRTSKYYGVQVNILRNFQPCTCPGGGGYSDQGGLSMWIPLYVDY